MKICALTMVYRDYWALSQWYRYFGHALGARNLFVVVHGLDPIVSQICPEANVITIPRDDLSAFDRRRTRLLNGFQDGLSQVYDWVIRTDADELICLDPSLYDSFDDLFRREKGAALFALGLNLAESDRDAELDPAANVLAHRRTAVFSGHYSKAWAVRQRVPLVRHGIKVAPSAAEAYPFRMPRGVYLVHLKFANRSALAEANHHRIEVATAEGKGLPGDAWRHADEEADAFFAQTAAKPFLDWGAAEQKAYAKLGKAAARNATDGLVRAKSIKFPFRTELDRWFADIL